MPITSAVDLPKLAVAEVNHNEYLSVIGSCLHISQVSRPDIAYAVGVLSRHSSTPGPQHMEAAINLVCYLYHTQDLFVQYTRAPNGNNPHVYEKDWSHRKSIEERLRATKPEAVPMSAEVYVDADYAGDHFTRRSTSGMLTMMNNGPISWSSRLQKLCAQSSAERAKFTPSQTAQRRQFTSNCYVRSQASESPGGPSLFTKTIPHAFTWVMAFLVPRQLNTLQCALGS